MAFFRVCCNMLRISASKCVLVTAVGVVSLISLCLVCAQPDRRREGLFSLELTAPSCQGPFELDRF